MLMSKSFPVPDRIWVCVCSRVCLCSGCGFLTIGCGATWSGFAMSMLSVIGYLLLTFCPEMQLSWFWYQYLVVVCLVHTWHILYFHLTWCKYQATAIFSTNPSCWFFLKKDANCHALDIIKSIDKLFGLLPKQQTGTSGKQSFEYSLLLSEASSLLTSEETRYGDSLIMDIEFVITDLLEQKLLNESWRCVLRR